MKYIAYRNLIGVTHTEAEAKAEAEAIMVCSIKKLLLVLRFLIKYLFSIGT